MEILKLWNSQLCLPAPEVKEVILEVVEEVVVQEVAVIHDPMVVSSHQDCIMEEPASMTIVSKTQQVGVFVSQSYTGTSSGEISIKLIKTIEEIKADNAMVKEHLDKQDLMFQLILFRLPSPPPQNF